MTMRQVLWSGVGVAFGVSCLTASAQDKREVIASSNPRPVASLGQPQSQPSAKVRAQKDEQPVVPVPASPMPATVAPNTPPSSSIVLPYPQPMPTTLQAAPNTVVAAPMPESGPCLNCLPGQYDLGAAVVAGGPCDFGPGQRNNRWYVSGEYLYWWTRDAGLPPLVTTGSPQSNTVIESGNLSTAVDPNTQVIYGNAPLDNQGRSGARVEIGRWFGQCRPWAIELGGFALGDRSTSYQIDSTQTTPLSRPIIIANIPREGVNNFAQPGILAGSIAINTSNSFYGANLDWRRRVWCGCRYNLDGILGVRFLNFDESLNIVEQSQVIADNVVAPNLNNVPVPRGLRNIITDQFSVDNEFVGGTMGLKGTYQLGRFSLDMGAQVSLGSTNERLTIAGNQVIVYPNGQQFNFAGGLLARPSNIGTYSQDKFTAVPEVNFTVGYQATQHLKLTLGYDFLYWSNMLRVGDQVSRTVNINGIPYFPQTGVAGNTDPVTGGPIPAGPVAPTVRINETDFWAQGISVGLLCTW